MSTNFKEISREVSSLIAKLFLSTYIYFDY